MDEGGLWELIAESRRESDNDTALTSRLLFRRLRVLSATEIADFVQLWEQVRSHLYTWPVTDAICLLLGVVEEDDLPHAQDWIISYGRSVVERTIRTPDSLVELAADVHHARAPWFGEFATEAHIVITGSWPLGYDPDGPADLLGEHIDLADHAVARQQFPRLTAFRRQHADLGIPELR
ncbi:DUF4240 domain-containing protein [Actinoplanes palleronii]|uniref:DUF4240 domain-containing protein n=1 Tax=Actinoplanes palleronii TaxID=113570 RepID=A0ABQ4BRQ9_9ACTN|nr:DUF4240 domain-containing protein [Actinoplanes palleronii]GIE73355.1 hypothetical protein Apa02nite_094630 [Actinoplanes palleronii]